MVGTGDAPESAIHYLDDLAHRYGAASWSIARGDDPGAAIVIGTRLNRDLACLATHGRDRSAAVLGSVAKEVLDRTTDPVMLVGPKARPPCAGDAPVVVAADGGPGDPAVVAVGVEWAARLERPLVVAMVAEPVRGSFRESMPLLRHAWGPEDAEAYVARLAIDASGSGTPVETRVVCDPINVRTGVLRLVGRTSALIVLGTHRCTRPVRALVGSQATRIVHDVEVPALVVPLDPQD
jgi:nucleotide-binding universal stress UspA family protein